MHDYHVRLNGIRLFKSLLYRKIALTHCVYYFVWLVLSFAKSTIL